MLLLECVNRGIPFIYASSASTYGAGKNGFVEVDECESALNPYAFSKLSFDRYARPIMAKSKSKIIGLKYFNVYGMQENHKGKMASIIYQMYNQLKTEDTIKLFKGTDGYIDGGQKRDFVFVKDVVKVNLWCLDNEIENGVYNCGTGHAHSFNDVAVAVIEAVGHGKVEYIDMPEVLKGKYQSYTQADMSKLLNSGYNGGFTELKDAVKEYCEVLSENEGYYR